jgi:hypothetical protein
VTSSQFHELREVFGEERRVVIVNVKVPRPWEGPNNAMPAAGVARWPNAVLVDWDRHGAATPSCSPTTAPTWGRPVSGSSSSSSWPVFRTTL